MGWFIEISVGKNSEKYISEAERPDDALFRAIKDFLRSTELKHIVDIKLQSAPLTELDRMGTQKGLDAAPATVTPNEEIRTPRKTVGRTT